MRVSSCARNAPGRWLRCGDSTARTIKPVSVPMLTPGYNLQAKHVIHIVGPIVADAVTETDRRALYNGLAQG